MYDAPDVNVAGIWKRFVEGFSWAAGAATGAATVTWVGYKIYSVTTKAYSGAQAGALAGAALGPQGAVIGSIVGGGAGAAAGMLV